MLRSAPDNAVPCLDIRDIGKSFPGGVRALKQVSFTVAPGQVHGLLGANGAGKSTLMKILTGVYPHGRYDGEFLLRGVVAKFQSPRDALSAGLGYVPQELNVVEQLTVAENIFVGRLTADDSWKVSLNDVRRRATALLERWGISLDPGQLVARLRASDRQLVMIARSLATEPSLLVLDEPTSSLTSDETARLFGILRGLTDAGVTVILITHRMPEIFEMCDAVTILRDGMAVSTIPRAEFAHDAMVNALIGRPMGTLFPSRRDRDLGPETLRVEHLSVQHPHAFNRRVVDDVSFSVRRGEIVGIAGLMGAGRTELLNALYGRLRYEGEVYVDARPLHIRNERDAKRARIALLTEDRKNEGMLFNRNIGENISIGSLEAISTRGVLKTALERVSVDKYFQSLQIKAPDLRTMVVNLSGGNQQKVIFARMLMEQPEVILLDEPTKGVDISAKQEIYRVIISLAENGAAVVMVSSEFSELIGICDRILVMADGQFVEEVPGQDANETDLVAAASGGL
jgi:ribose transport system ATP-binding protein